jgi:hypothetical protein
MAYRYRVVLIDPSGFAMVLSRHRVFARALARALARASKYPGIVDVETQGGLCWSGLPWK